MFARAIRKILPIRKTMNEREYLNQELLKCRDIMPLIPQLVLLVDVAQKNSINSEIVNNMVLSMMGSNFTVEMFPSMEPDKIYIALTLALEELELEAEFINMRIKMADLDTKRVYKRLNKGFYEPFRSKDIQNIMLSKLQRIVNIQGLKEKNIILEVITMHSMSSLHEISFHWYRSVNSSELEKRAWLKIP
jgi:hypothetical protein